MIVMNNSSYGLVAWGNTLVYGRVHKDIAGQEMDICGFAKSLGALAARVESIDDWRKIDVMAGLRKSLPFVIDVIVPNQSHGETPPIASRISVLKSKV